MFARFSLVIIILFTTLSFNSFATQKKTYALSKRVYNKLQQVNELIEAKDYPASLLTLDEILERKLSDYERAQVWYMKGTVFYQQSDITSALSAFEKTVQNPDKLPELLAQGTLRTVVQLHLSLNNNDKALNYVTKLLTLTTKPELDYVLSAQVRYKKEDYQTAKIEIEKAIAAYKQLQKTPKENALLLQNAIYFELQAHENMLKTLKELTMHYPKAKYLLFMASVYGQMGNTKEQTIILESLYEDNKLTTNSQFISLASLYLAEKVPYKSAKLLDKAMQNNLIEKNKRNLEMLSQAWLMSNELEHAINSLSDAAKLSDNGELYLRQSYLLYDNYQWQAAITAVELALAKGFDKQDKIGESLLLKGMLLFNLERYDEAIENCQLAAEYKKSKKFAEQWVTYISNEKAKVELLLQ